MEKLLAEIGENHGRSIVNITLVDLDFLIKAVVCIEGGSVVQYCLNPMSKQVWRAGEMEIE